MVKPAIVFAVGLLRATNRSITDDDWTWMCSNAGQQLFYPPDVSGWDDSRWLDTSTMAGRWVARQRGDARTHGQAGGRLPGRNRRAALAAAPAALGKPAF